MVDAHIAIDTIQNVIPTKSSPPKNVSAAKAGTAINAIVAAIIPNRLVMFNIKTPYSLFPY